MPHSHVTTATREMEVNHGSDRGRGRGRGDVEMLLPKGTHRVPPPCTWGRHGGPRDIWTAGNRNKPNRAGRAQTSSGGQPQHVCVRCRWTLNLHTRLEQAVETMQERSMFFVLFVPETTCVAQSHGCLHKQSSIFCLLLPVPCSLFPVPCALFARSSQELPALFCSYSSDLPRLWFFSRPFRFRFRLQECPLQVWPCPNKPIKASIFHGYEACFALSFTLHVIDIGKLQRSAQTIRYGTDTVTI